MSEANKNKSTLTKQQAREELWSRGELKFLCHAIQKQMYDLYYKSPNHSILCWLLARQSGKSYLLAILALEAALRKPNSVIKLVTDTKIHLKSIFEPIFNELLKDCPENCKPHYYQGQYYYSFLNGSQIQLAGSDGKHYEKLRGQKSDLVLVDEAGFCKDLKSMVISVLLPTTTHTGGKIVLASTPSEDPEHDFIEFVEKSEMEGTLVKKTIYDNPLLGKFQIENMIKQMGGVNSERFRREYLCERIKDSVSSVVPEFTPELEEQIVTDWVKPPFYDCYVSMDLGFKDLTVALFMYYDFRKDKIVVEDELVANFQDKEMNIEKFTQLLVRKEENIWLNVLTNEVKAPYIRVSDINPIVTNEIRKYSNGKVIFQTAKKDDKSAAINVVRQLLAAKKIIINPRCVTLIRHLKNVRWATSKDTFARSADNGHYDAFDALVYGVRSMHFNKNPYPAHYNMDMRDIFIANPESFNKNDTKEVFRKIFGIKR